MPPAYARNACARTDTLCSSLHASEQFRPVLRNHKYSVLNNTGMAILVYCQYYCLRPPECSTSTGIQVQYGPMSISNWLKEKEKEEEKEEEKEKEKEKEEEKEEKEEEKD